jgi:hypothetical protein
MNSSKLILAIAALMCLGNVPCKARILAHWSFDEQNGTVVHDSAGSFNGTLSPNGSAFVSGGISGNAISLNRALNGFVTMGNVLGSSNQPLSVVAWLKTAPGYNIDDSAIVSKHAAFTQNGFWLMVNRAGGGGQTGKAIFGEGAAARSVTSTTTVNDGNWHQIVATFQPGVSLTIYVDGAPAENSSSASPSLIPNNVPFLIGAVNVGPPEGRLTGLVDEVQIYNHVLTAEEVNFLFHNPTAVALDCPDLLAATQAQLSAANDQIAQANSQIAQLQAQLDAAHNELSAIDDGLHLLTLYFRDTFRNATFQIPGTNSAAQVNSMVQAIGDLNYGQQKAVYFNLGGERRGK